VHAFENDTGPDDANHAHEGLYVLVADGVRAGTGPERDLRDVTQRSSSCSASLSRPTWRA